VTSRLKLFYRRGHLLAFLGELLKLECLDGRTCTSPPLVGFEEPFTCSSVFEKRITQVIGCRSREASGAAGRRLFVPSTI